MGTFDENFDLRTLKGADYNPRRIDESDLAELRASLRVLGIVKPIIARGETIVAGHQRTRSALEVGITHGPVYSLGTNASKCDEVRFNQLHNGTDLDTGAEPVKITRDLAGVRGWLSVDPDEVEGNFRSQGAIVRVEIQKLVARFGPWGACVVAPDGRVVHCSHYALALAIMRKPIACYVLKPEQVEPARRYLERSYGVFDYAHLKKNPYVQTHAQPYRLRGETAMRSLTYDEYALPWLKANPGARLLDFGSGQGDHAAEAVRNGFNVLGVELFRRVKGRVALDVGASRSMVQALARALREHGRFDGVICDFVLNSVDCPQAEDSVLACLDLFVKPGGRLFVSGRSMERVTSALRDTRAGSRERRVHFMDKSGFTAIYYMNAWFYQRYHTKDEVEAMPERFGWEAVKQRRNASDWAVHAVKLENKLTRAQYEAAVRYEFSLPVNSKGRTLGVLDDMLEAAAHVW